MVVEYMTYHNNTSAIVDASSNLPVAGDKLLQ